MLVEWCVFESLLGHFRYVVWSACIHLLHVDVQRACQLRSAVVDQRMQCRWLAKNKHLRYMWIPYTDTVVVVKCNETKNPETPKPGMFTKVHSEAEKLQPMRALLQTTAADVQVRIVSFPGCVLCVTTRVLSFRVLPVNLLQRVHHQRVSVRLRAARGCHCIRQPGLICACPSNEM